MNKADKLNITSWVLVIIANIAIAATLGYMGIFINHDMEFWIAYALPIGLFMIAMDGVMIYLYKIGKSTPKKGDK